MDLKPIGFVNNIFKEKFGIPKQAQMNEIPSQIQFSNSIKRESFRGLEEMSHIWLIFGFHMNKENCKATVRPPILGGNERVGLYSSRSSFRHNNLGLSLVELLSVDLEKNILNVLGLDCMDGTPIFDIKPYHPVADIPKSEVRLGWIEKSLNITESWVRFECNISEQLKSMIVEVLKNNPRPSYQSDDRIYGTLLDSYNVKWKQIKKNEIIVLKVETL